MPLSPAADRERQQRRRHQIMNVHTAWWTTLFNTPPPPISPATWNRRCDHCNALLLSTESDAFCCGNGHRALPRLHPLPPRMRALLQDANHASHLLQYGRLINNLFSFAGIGVSGGFEHFAPGSGPPAVAITGRTYHLIRDTEYTGDRKSVV